MVCKNDKVVGVLSERDVVRAVARDGQAALANVRCRPI
jgi:CBS domain-containing protein